MAQSEVLHQLSEYVGFGPEDHSILKELQPALRGDFRWIVDDFYAAIEREPAAAAVLKGPEQIERLKGSLRDWIDGVFCGVYDDAYFERRARIGRVHVRVGLEQRFAAPFQWVEVPPR